MVNQVGQTPVWSKEDAHRNSEGRVVVHDPRIAAHVAAAEDDSSADVAGQIAALEDRLDAAAVSYAGGRLERRQLEAITSQLTTEIDELRRRIEMHDHDRIEV